MKKRKLFILLIVLTLILSVRGSKYRVLSEATLPINSETSQIISPLDTVRDTSVNDEFQSFVETWKLSGLLPECRTMTTENEDEFVKYFQQFDDVTRYYIILLLQGIAADTITLADSTNDHKYGVYLMDCQFCLYDMNQDKAPELILKTGGCEADYMYMVYTVVNGKLINCGELSGSHSSLYIDGSGRFVRYEGHMGIYDIDVSTLEGTTINTQKIAD
jgi:hypothetical protein